MLKDTLNPLLLNIAQVEHFADWNWKGVNSPFSRIYIVKNGTATLHTPAGAFRMSPSHLYMIPAFTTHAYECNNYLCLGYIHFYEDGVSLLEQYNLPIEIEAGDFEILLFDRLLNINPGRQLVESDPALYDNDTILLQNIAIHANQTIHVKVETQGILQQLIARFLCFSTEKKPLDDNRIESSIDFIRKNINTCIKTSALAQRCYLSTDHFIRMFKKQFGETPLHYINRKKIERAQLMMIANNMPIKDIAYSLAFENLSYFNRIFKKTTGLTPSQYQEKKKLDKLN
jgi:AraC-like DNA-binding protein